MRKKKNYTTSRSYNKANIDLFKRLLSCTDCSPVLHITCPDQAYDTFMDIFTETHNIAFPLKQNIIPKRYLQRSVWMTNGLLHSSITKSKLFMKKLKKPSNWNINRYKQYIIQCTEQEKSFKFFLGIHMDETLTWKHHIGKVCSKISHSNYIIDKVKHILPKSSLHTLYLTIVQSHLNYGLHIWGSSNSIGKVLVSQKKSLRIIYNK